MGIFVSWVVISGRDERRDDGFSVERGQLYSRYFMRVGYDTDDHSSVSFFVGFLFFFFLLYILFCVFTVPFHFSHFLWLFSLILIKIAGSLV